MIEWNHPHMVSTELHFDSLERAHKASKMIRSQALLRNIPVTATASFIQNKFVLHVFHYEQFSNEIQDIIASFILSSYIDK